MRTASLALGLLLLPTVGFADPVGIVESGGFFSGMEDTGFNLSGTNLQFTTSKAAHRCSPLI